MVDDIPLQISEGEAAAVTGGGVVKVAATPTLALSQPEKASENFGLEVIIEALLV
jgi:hypothetical protein